MSQKLNEKQNPRAGVTSQQKVLEPEILGLSPDDDIGVKPPEGSGQPASMSVSVPAPTTAGLAHGPAAHGVDASHD